MKLLVCLALLLISTFFGVDSQTTVGRNDVGSCQLPDANALAETLIPLSFDLLDVNTPPTVFVESSTIVCVSPGLQRDTVSSVSLVSRFNCSGLQQCAGMAERLYQFQYDCNADDTFSQAQIVGNTLVTTNPLANLETALVDQCGRCAEPSGDVPSDAVTHCAG